MSARDIIVRPIITEKTSVASADNNTVTFEVAKNANKTAIAMSSSLKMIQSTSSAKTMTKEI